MHHSYNSNNGSLKKSTYGNGQSVEYLYDGYGRLSGEKVTNTSGGTAVQTSAYVYDALGRLSREKDYVNGHTSIYQYDIAGRLTRQITGQGNFLYSYDNLNRPNRMSFTFDGQSYLTTYDYLSANRPNRTDLVVGKVSRTYDNLQREIKHQVYSSDNGTTYLETTTAFIGVDGNQTTQLPRIYTTLRTDGVNDPTRPGGYTGFTYAYDANGNITAINESNGTTSRTRTYTYDALNRLKTDSDPVTGKTTTYTYNAWGKLISTTGSKANTIGKLNPFRYRGYVYDEETELYYVSSRYYDAEVGRFINADTTDVLTATPTALTDKNLFAYCDNNPITRADNGGEFWNIVIGAFVGGIVNGVTTAIDTYKSTGSIDWGKVGISAAVGAVSGAVAATGLGVLTQAAITAGTTALGAIATQKVCEGKEWSEINCGKAIYNGVVAGGCAVMGSAIGEIASTGYSTAGNNILSAGKDKLMTGYARKFTGQSSSKLIKQGRNLSALGKKYINTGRGISSVTGTLSTWCVARRYAMN